MPQKRYCIEALIFISYVLFAFSWVAGSFMMPEIMATFGIETISDATWATNAVNIAKIIGNFLAASLLVRLGIKKAFLASSALIVLGFFGAFAGSYSLYVLSRLVMGLGGAIVLVYFNPIVVRYFSLTERPVINGINSCPFNVGNLLAMVLTPVLLAMSGSWQNVILICSGGSLAVLFCWRIFP